MSRQMFIIVGASLAGANAAAELRERGFDGRVVLIGSEPERPYERPPLSKDYLRGESEREKAYVHEQGFYEQHEIELLTGTTVSEIDPGSSRIELADGAELAFRPAAVDHRCRAAPDTRPGGRAGRHLLPTDARRLRRPARAEKRGRARGGGRRRLDWLGGRRLGPPAWV